MKKVTLILTGILLYISAFADQEVVVQSKINNVTVFQNSAQVFRSSKFTAGKGTTTIVFENVSPYLNSKSIQVKGTGDFIILDVQFSIKQPEPILPENSPLPPKIIKDIAMLEDSLAYIEFDLEALTNRKEVLDAEKKIIQNNKLLQGKSDTIPEIVSALTVFREKLNDINTELLKIKTERYKITKVKTVLTNRIYELRAYNSHVNKPVILQAIPQVAITISAEKPVSGTMSIDYLVANAGWTPMYDLRAKGLDKPIQLTCKASVYQSSGEDWDDVRLKLSTINPSLEKSKPVLPVYYLDYYSYTAYYNRRGTDDGLLGEIAYGAPCKTDEGRESGRSISSAGSAYTYTQAQETMTNVEYDVNLPYSIPTDGASHVVAIRNVELTTEYYHYVVPKIDREAFLIAKITDWEKLDLLAGAANIYYDDSFVGETSLNPSLMADTMEIALGKDRGIIVERKKVKDEDKEDVVGRDKIKTVRYELKIKNGKTTKINLIVEDQLPVSQNPEIKIERLNLSEATFTSTSGLLSWRKSLEPNETKELTFSYTIEYKKDKALANIY